MLSEFGATDNPQIVDRVTSETDADMVSWIEWTFYGRDPCCARPNEGLIRNISKPPTPTNVKQGELAALVRPYPYAVAGTPASYGYDAATKVFKLTYSTIAPRRRVLRRARTLIVVPRLDYPTGYRVAVAGARVVSRPDARTVELLARRHARSVSVTIVPARKRRRSAERNRRRGTRGRRCSTSRSRCSRPRH